MMRDLGCGAGKVGIGGFPLTPLRQHWSWQWSATTRGQSQPSGRVGIAASRVQSITSHKSQHVVWLRLDWRYISSARCIGRRIGSLTICTTTRPRPLLSLLAGDARLLRRQHKLRGRLGQEEVRSHARGLLRVPTPPQRGTIASPTQENKALF